MTTMIIEGWRLLQRCGEALYGSRWQSELARGLQVSDRTVRRWLRGDTDVPGRVYADLIDLCSARAGELHDLIEMLDLAVSDGEARSAGSLRSGAAPDATTASPRCRATQHHRRSRS